MQEKRRPSRLRRVRSVALAAFVAIGLGTIAAVGSSPLPPIGPAFNPGTGIWTSAADAQLPKNQTLHVPGLRGSASVTFERGGEAHVRADNDHDLFLATGYLHARFRLFQMDVQRRQGEGLLSQIVG